MSRSLNKPGAVRTTPLDQVLARAQRKYPHLAALSMGSPANQQRYIWCSATIGTVDGVVAPTWPHGPTGCKESMQDRQKRGALELKAKATLAGHLGEHLVDARSHNVRIQRRTIVRARTVTACLACSPSTVYSANTDSDASIGELAAGEQIIEPARRATTCLTWPPPVALHEHQVGPSVDRLAA